jgi:hypothetical protein
VYFFIDDGTHTTEGSDDEAVTDLSHGNSHESSAKKRKSNEICTMIMSCTNPNLVPRYVPLGTYMYLYLVVMYNSLHYSFVYTPVCL